MALSKNSGDTKKRKISRYRKKKREGEKARNKQKINSTTRSAS